MNQFMLAPNVGQSSNSGYTPALKLGEHTLTPTVNMDAAPQTSSSNDGVKNNEEVRENTACQNSHASQLATNVQSHNPGPCIYVPQTGFYIPTSFGSVDAQLEKPQAELPSDAGTKPETGRKPRTCFASHQLLALEQSFKENQHMTRLERIKLAKALGLNEMQVKTWFQNRRTKQKTLVNGNEMKFNEVYIKEEPDDDADINEEKH